VVNSGRHILLKASLDGEEVVLKGFVMNNYAQRKGFEREISILGKLRNDSIICPGAIVEGSGTSVKGFEDPSLQVTIFIQYPFCRGGNLSQWLKTAPRKPWELQAIARQILYVVVYLHDYGVIHKDIKPSNILMHEDGRIVLADFELAREMRRRSINSSNINGIEIASGFEGPNGENTLQFGAAEDRYLEEDITASMSVSGTRGFMAPEIESGGNAVYASDMYSFGVLLMFMHFPNSLATLLPGQPNIPLSPVHYSSSNRSDNSSHANTSSTNSSSSDSDLIQLIQKLLSLEPKDRPTAANCVVHPYFRATYMDRLLKEGEVVEQDRKLEAVRNMLQKTRNAHKTSFDKIVVRRSEVLMDTLKYFMEMPLDRIKRHLKVEFVDEPGVDQGGLLTELFTMYFEEVFEEKSGLFEGHNTSSGSSGGGGTVVLPSVSASGPVRLAQLRAVGISLVKALYEGKRIGNRLCPSVFKFLSAVSNINNTLRDLQIFDPHTAKSLQWMQATSGVDQFSLHFESVGLPQLGLVTDLNKAQFIATKIDHLLVQSRLPQLQVMSGPLFQPLLLSYDSDCRPSREVSRKVWLLSQRRPHLFYHCWLTLTGECCCAARPLLVRITWQRLVAFQAFQPRVAYRSGSRSSSSRSPTICSGSSLCSSQAAPACPPLLTHRTLHQVGIYFYQLTYHCLSPHCLYVVLVDAIFR